MTSRIVLRLRNQRDAALTPPDGAEAAINSLTKGLWNHAWDLTAQPRDSRVSSLGICFLIDESNQINTRDREYNSPKSQISFINQIKLNITLGLDAYL